jgi:hypothetical protein
MSNGPGTRLNRGRSLPLLWDKSASALLGCYLGSELVPGFTDHRAEEGAVTRTPGLDVGVDQVLGGEWVHGYLVPAVTR